MLGRHDAAAGWLRIWTDLGRAPRTIDAYARGLAEYLEVCEREGVDPVTANRAHVAVFVRELTSRPSRRGANVVSIDSGPGWRTPRSSSGWSRSGCFMTTSSRKACASPTRSGAGSSRRAAASEARSAG